MGRPFEVSRSNYVVADYHIDLLQIVTSLELANLSISDYSRIFEDSYNLLKSDVAD